LATLHSDGDSEKIDPAVKRLLGAYTIGPENIIPPELVLAKISSDGVQELNG